MNCLHCGTETQNPKFCSKSCAAKVTNRIPKRQRKIRVCSKCHLKLAHGYRSSTCMNCKPERASEKLKTLTLREARQRYKSPTASYAHALVRHHCHMLFKNLTKSCLICGYDKHVELCHIKPISSFEEDATFELINSPSNVVGLCPNHHWELDNGLLSITSSRDAFAPEER